MQSIENLDLCRNMHSYPVEDELLLFNSQSRQLVLLNKTAAFIWKGIEQGCSTHDIIHAMAQSTGNTAAEISQDINNLTHQLYSSLGITQIPAGDEEQQSLVESFKLPVLNSGKNEIILKSSTGPQLCYKIIDTHIRLRFPSKRELSVVKPIIAHLMIEGNINCDVDLRIAKTKEGYVLLNEGDPIDCCKEVDGIAPMVHANATMIAYDRTNCFIGLHAAAVVCQGKCILMPAVSGSGKSTLTAALIGTGFDYCADDLVLLSNPPIQMCPVPTAIGLKSGSWEPIGDYHPGVASLTAHLRIDGQKVRYMAPCGCSMKKPESLSVDCIVFPHFNRNGEAASIETLRAGEGLYKLAEAGYDVPNHLTADKVKQLIDWIVNIPKFVIRFNQLDNAVSMIRSLAA